jgi:hypothetical protein
VAIGDAKTQLTESGVALLRNVLVTDSLTRFQEAAGKCFEAIGTEKSLPAHYHFNPYSHSVVLAALADFGCGLNELLEPLSAPGLGQLISEGLGCEWTCKMEHSWVRKKFPPRNAPGPQHQPQSWHQDGGLGVHFPLEAGPVLPMTELLTCWIPLNDCGRDSPGLEFVRGRQAALLHFTKLDDRALRERFPPQAFWAPELEFGDGLIFLNSVLHRTYAVPQMTQNRLSVEYRMFPTTKLRSSKIVEAC